MAAGWAAFPLSRVSLWRGAVYHTECMHFPKYLRVPCVLGGALKSAKGHSLFLRKNEAEEIRTVNRWLRECNRLREG